MFKIIEPQDYDTYKTKINSLLDLFKIYHNFCLSPEEESKATFIIAEDDKRGVYGGAVLYPQKISSSFDLTLEDTREEVLGKMFSAFQPKGQEYCVARTGFYSGQNAEFPIEETIKLCQDFYKNIYKAFVEFGEKKKVEYLPFTLRTADTRVDNTVSILTYKSWPYLFEVRPEETSKEFFHGILSLKKKKFKIRQNVRIPLERSPSMKVNPPSLYVTASEGGMK